MKLTIINYSTNSGWYKKGQQKLRESLAREDVDLVFTFGTPTNLTAYEEKIKAIKDAADLGFKYLMKITEETKTWSSNQVPGTMKGHTVCSATHPDKPNHSGHSRGRKIHLVKTLEKTFCNMKVDEFAPQDYRFYSMTSNGTCKSCLNAIK